MIEHKAGYLLLGILCGLVLLHLLASIAFTAAPTHGT